MNKFKLAIIGSLIIGIAGSASLLASDDKPATKEYVLDSVAIEAIDDGSLAEIIITDDNGNKIEAVEAADYKEVVVPGTNDSFKYGYTVDSQGNFVYGTIYTNDPKMMEEQSSDVSGIKTINNTESGGATIQETVDMSLIYHSEELFNEGLSQVYGSDVTFEELDNL